MAESVASPLCLKLHLRNGPVTGRGFSFQNMQFKILQQRKRSYASCKFVHYSELSAPHVSDFVVSPCPWGIHLKTTCLWSLVDLDSATTSDLVPTIDHVLLMASMLLTYMAGVIPVQKSYKTSQKIISDKSGAHRSSDVSGSAMRSNDQFDSKYVMNVVREKLLDSLNASEHEANSRIQILQFKEQVTKKPWSLKAVADGPRLRLLWAAFQQVEEEVNSISAVSGTSSEDDLFNVFSEVIQRSCQPVCMAWLENELSFEKSNTDEALASRMFGKLKENKMIVPNIRKCGKEGLYAELLCYLSLGSVRDNSLYNRSLFVSHGISMLEDLVITLADEVASVYLELISVDSEVASEINSLNLALCTLSTRLLQKLRNEVVLNQWLYDNIDTVVSMYEDRFDLCTLQSQLIDTSKYKMTETVSWWKRITLRKSVIVSPELHGIVINHLSMTVKRTKELRALTGWQYYFSLILELSDITAPLIRAVIDKVSDAISFFLRCLIGRSLGLIYTGIRQSLRWK